VPPAKHLGRSIEELYVSAADFARKTPPFARFLAFATSLRGQPDDPDYIASRMARRSVTVVRCPGDGGDELFVADRYADADQACLLTRTRTRAIIRSLVSNLNDAILRPVAERWGNTRWGAPLGTYRQLPASKCGCTIINVSGLPEPVRGKLMLSDSALNLNPLNGHRSYDPSGHDVAFGRMTLFKVDCASMSTSLEVRRVRYTTG